MVPTIDQMLSISGGKGDRSNIASIILGLDKFGAKAGLDRPHRLAHYLAQLAEESGDWRYDRELASGAEYEGRKDLGNVNAGDGVKFKGRTGGQITGRSNYHALTVWVRSNVSTSAPDFEAQPDLLNTDPWEGLGPIWFWSTHGLNTLADENNIEAITKRINGGLNGYAVRVANFTRAALVLLGYGPADVRAFQQKANLVVDGDSGPKTRAALFMALTKLDDAPAAIDVKPAPVVSEVAVVPKGSDKRGWLWGGMSGLSLSTVVSAFADVPWQVKVGAGIVALAIVVIMLFIGDRIIRRVKTLRDEIGST